MKTDNYLSLCLEQAAKSPLHYRHGAIVVRGGKVIGHGFNDYRPGFNGGALKHGRIAKTGAFDGDAMMELKKKLKGRQKLQQPEQQQQHTCSTFTPFETNNGGGHTVNQPLSMHSEMMAIYSALNASSTLSSSTFSREKPCFKLPRSDKRKARLRREVLLAYVAAVCEAAISTGQWQVDLNLALNLNNKPEHDNDNKTPQYHNKTSLAFHEKKSHEYHYHENLKEKKKNGKKNEYQYQYKQYEYKSNKRAARRGAEPDAVYEHDATTMNDRDDNDLRNVTNRNDVNEDTSATASQCGGKGKRAYKRSGKMRTDNPTLDNEASSGQPVLLPTSRVGRPDVLQRQQHSRLRGADVYVTRLGWSGKPKYKPAKVKNKASQASSQESAITPEPAGLGDNSLTESISSLSILSLSSLSSGTGSLHDELVNREPMPPPLLPARETGHHFDRNKIHASRPCYRCISFMHQVGIRRVFWTNDAGEWEGEKVASLVDAMDAGMDNSAAGDAGPTGNGLFVTKHEVLMLRRMMGNNGK